jgi:hypothetical protein
MDKIKDLNNIDVTVITEMKERIEEIRYFLLNYEIDDMMKGSLQNELTTMDEKIENLLSK